VRPGAPDKGERRRQNKHHAAQGENPGPAAPPARGRNDNPAPTVSRRSATPLHPHLTSGCGGVVLRNLLAGVYKRTGGSPFASASSSQPRPDVPSPGRACSLVGWLTIGGHRGINHVLFRGRVQKHQLQPGVYRLVPKAGAPDLASLPTIGVVVDRHGVRPATSVASGSSRRVRSSASQQTHWPGPHQGQQRDMRLRQRRLGLRDVAGEASDRRVLGPRRPPS
jgi:hypothetical protein